MSELFDKGCAQIEESISMVHAVHKAAGIPEWQAEGTRLQALIAAYGGAAFYARESGNEEDGVAFISKVEQLTRQAAEKMGHMLSAVGQTRQ